jgi:uncharacterized protein (TIGR02099 family)
MLNLLTISNLWHHLKRLTRVAIIVSTVFAMLIGVAIILLRYWILPDVERYHERIASSLSQAIGSEVVIGKIEADWRGIHPHLAFREVQLLDEQKRPALVLPSIEGSVSWLSLPMMELRLRNLAIDQPQLLLLRNRQGRIFVGGVALREGDDDKSFANWILHQSRVVVRGARVVWADETRDAPPLVLDDLNLRIDNGLFNRHRFGLHARLPEALATPLDIRGDLHGESFNDPGDWSGKLFMQVDYTDVTAWHPWAELPAELRRGRGGVRSWLDIRAGQLAGVTADLDLRQLQSRFSPELPELDAPLLRGRVGWQSAEGDTTFAVRQLMMQLGSGQKLPATDFRLRLQRDKAGNVVAGEVDAGRVQMESLLVLSPFLPMAPEWRSQLEQYRPAGTLDQLQFAWDGAPGSWRLKWIHGGVRDIGFAAVGKIPGLSGFTATIDGDDDGGRITLDSRQIVLEAPDALPEPVALDTLTGQLGWRPKGKEWKLAFENVSFANPDVAGTLYGSYQTQSGTPGVIDLNLALTRGEVRSAARYTPFIALAPKDNEWLAGALQAGETSDFRLRIKGNLNDFPLKENSSAILELGGHARGGVLEFDKNWPKIENIDGEFWIRGRRMELRSDSAMVMGGQIRKVTAAVSDLTALQMNLAVKGEVAAPSERFLEFIQKSPVRDYIDGFTDDMRARGDGNLKLSMQIPLLGEQPFRLNGAFSVVNNDIDLGENMPLLRNARGGFNFTENSVAAESVNAEILGGNASLSFKSDADGLRVSAQGRADIDALRRKAPSWLLDHLGGNARWNARFVLGKASRSLQISSDLVGLRSSLPGAFAKTAAVSLPLKVEMPNAPQGQEKITARLGKLASADISRQAQGWGATATLTTPTMSGEVVWSPAGQGKLSAKLKNVVWVESQPATKAGTARAQEKLLPSQLPALDIHVEDLVWSGKQIGKFDFVGEREADAWRLHRLLIDNPDGSLSGSGLWQAPNGASSTQLKLTLKISNAGKVLSRSGYPDTVKDGSGQLTADMNWQGAPDDFNYRTLDGALILNAGKGQFLKMKPGIGKLLGILSLQSLPKRITLDFNDVFSDGFQFDSIKGTANINNGMMTTEDLKLDGSSAKVTMKGWVDLNHETQNLRVRILPTLGDSVSLIGAFAAGPAVGVGALLVNKVLGEPLDKLASFEYNVSGTWSDPLVAKVGQGSANSATNQPEQK